MTPADLKKVEGLIKGVDACLHQRGFRFESDERSALNEALSLLHQPVADAWRPPSCAGCKHWTETSMSKQYNFKPANGICGQLKYCDKFSIDGTFGEIETEGDFFCAAFEPQAPSTKKETA